MRLLRVGGAALVCAAFLLGSVAGAADPPPTDDDESWPIEDPGTRTSYEVPSLDAASDEPDTFLEQLLEKIRGVVTGP